jgi:chaperonin GroEL (HSP60 family)
MPTLVENARIALIEESLETRTPETESRISISSPEQLQQFITQEDFMLKKKVEQIKNSGANVLFCQKGIEETVQFNLAKEGIFAVRRVPKSDMQSISKATHAKIYSQLNDLAPEGLGKAKKVEELKEGEDRYTQVTGCENPNVLTILLRGGTDHLLDEIERAIKDALGDVFSIFKDSKVLPGGGAIEIEVARQLRNYSQSLSGREQLAVEEFASALEFIPRTLAENAGLDSIDTITELKSAHDSGNSRHGLNLFNGKIEDTFSKGIIEPLKVKTQAIGAATEAAIMILRIDDVIAAKSKGKNKISNLQDYD